MWKTALEKELFPDLCEVVHIPLHNQYVYLIQKNGSSSLRIQQSKENLRIFSNEQISSLSHVDIYIRNPRERYVSGINTYVQHLQREHPELDINTVLWFVKRYKFLNTHYLPQLFWIANLSKYLSVDTKLRFRNFQDFSKIANIHSSAGVVAPSQDFVQHILDDSKIEFWAYVDQILLDLQGKELLWNELLEHLETNFPLVLNALS